MTNISALKYLPIDHDAVGKKNIYLYEICEPWLDGDVYIALCLGRVTPNEREKKNALYLVVLWVVLNERKKKEKTRFAMTKKKKKRPHTLFRTNRGDTSSKHDQYAYICTHSTDSQ